ncbi:hypothetical protein [Aneurinibacillus tyrosinisolvens]|uniref:hypothetical protein n=1 Tax=Aneurinibacillus tyrosinisolvens TaxID=1443435 RepID=UPI00063F4F90|nr:hypothetical protein [Aneurinibacillus tyrosinisolvens]
MDNKRKQEVSQLKDALDAWCGQTLLITKEEDGDTDSTILQLDEVVVKEREETVDDYIPSRSLLLKGNGSVRSETAVAAPLPYESYEIPIEEIYESELGAADVQIVTDRARYRIVRNAV